MTTNSTNQAGFSLLELLVAMAIFAMAAVSLTKAINLIGLSVVESIENASLREQMRAILIEESRNPNPRSESRETATNEQGLYFKIEIELLIEDNREGIPLDNLYEVTVIAMKQDAIRGTEEIDSVSTLVYPGLFQSQ